MWPDVQSRSPPAPADLLPPDATWPEALPDVCDTRIDYENANLDLSKKAMNNQMLSASDREIGRLLVEAGTHILHCWGGHSVYDFNNDGMTDGADLSALLAAIAADR